VIVDSSAILAIFFRESGSEDLLSRILDAEFAGVGAPTATETGVVLTKHLAADAPAVLRRFFHETGITVLPFTDRHWRRAVDAYALFSKGRHPAALNFGDCMTYATAAVAAQPLLCRGEDFRRTDIELA
jgi:ribonuclease VapC